MSYSRKELGEMALRRINAGHSKPEFNVDIREVMIAIDQERDRQVGDYYKRKVLSGDRQIDSNVLQSFTFPKDSGVLKQITINSENFTYYTFQLPFKVISLPYDLGLYEVSDEENPFITYHRMPTSMGLYSMSSYGADLDVLDSYRDGAKSYRWSLEGDILHIWGRSSSIQDAGIRVKALTSSRIELSTHASAPAKVEVPGGTGIGSTAQPIYYSHNSDGGRGITAYPIPAELVMPVIDAVVARYTYNKPYDSVVDNQDRA